MTVRGTSSLMSQVWVFVVVCVHAGKALKLKAEKL